MDYSKHSNCFICYIGQVDNSKHMGHMDYSNDFPSCSRFLHLAYIFRLVIGLLVTQLCSCLVIIDRGTVFFAGVCRFVKHISNTGPGNSVLFEFRCCTIQLQRNQHDTVPNWTNHERRYDDEAFDEPFGCGTCSGSTFVSGLMLIWS